jgi:hypothetical protein
VYKGLAKYNHKSFNNQAYHNQSVIDSTISYKNYASSVKNAYSILKTNCPATLMDACIQVDAAWILVAGACVG